MKQMYNYHPHSHLRHEKNKALARCHKVTQRQAVLGFKPRQFDSRVQAIGQYTVLPLQVGNLL